MDFRQFGSTSASKQEAAPVASTVSAPHPASKRANSTDAPKWLNVLSVAVLFGVAVLLLLLSVLFARGNSSGDELK